MHVDSQKTTMAVKTTLGTAGQRIVLEKGDFQLGRKNSSGEKVRESQNCKSIREQLVHC